MTFRKIYCVQVVGVNASIQRCEYNIQIAHGVFLPANLRIGTSTKHFRLCFEKEYKTLLLRLGQCARSRLSFWSVSYLFMLNGCGVPAKGEPFAHSKRYLSIRSTNIRMLHNSATNDFVKGVFGYCLNDASVGAVVAQSHFALKLS